MKLFIMRHGIAVERKEWPGSDADRPLTPDGIRKTQQAVRGLRRALEGEPLHIIAGSPLLRARQTAEIVRGTLPVHAQTAIWAELESADFAPLIQRLKEAEQSGDQSTLIVGHEPGLSQFTARIMTGFAHGLEVEWKKAAVCALEVNCRHDRPRAKLLWFASPKLLRFMGKE
ncbi:MAG: phosphohistidine phosphatase [Abditibacteriota bacterium]|nr:phosphohistidine phosphatase [Abditibacteriota bacterium]